MKKLLITVTATLTLLLSACGASESKDPARNETQDVGETVSEAANPATTNRKYMEVNKGLFSNKITIPASMLEGQDFDQVTAEAKKNGADEVTKNEDGSITYKISKSAYKSILKEYEKIVLDYVKKLKTGELFESIKDVNHNKSFSEFTLIVDRTTYDSEIDGMASEAIAYAASPYQVYSGVSSEKMKITVSIQDEATKEIFETRVFPEASEQ
ncbi:hypothetical protein ACFQZE_08245 [Paenibacillus sp. GCM10027627]|uniref:hypothetical protein n=1 Tax=unclassified Paenibacillus TaxID=185978 RepID=UPI0036300544